MLYPIDTPSRETKRLDGLWQFAMDRGRIGKDEAWYESAPTETVEIAVPGSISEQFVNRELYTYLDWAWYFKEFYVPASWIDGKRVFVHFGSATHRADLYCNGEHLGSHEGGFTPFEFEITDTMIAGGKNRLCVRLDNLLDETTIPQGNLDPSVGGVAAWRAGNFPNVHYDVFPYMGLHRPVTLYATGESRIEKLFVTTLALGERAVTARFQMVCSDDLDTAEIAIEELGFKTRVPIVKDACDTQLDIPGAEAWSPKNPKLYDIEITVMKKGTAIDIYTLPFGFRTIEVRGEQLLLNGDPLFLRGFGKHEDVPVAGKGLSLPYLIKDYSLMKWIGANSFRTTHYPYAEEVLQMADRSGIVIIDESAANTLSMRAVTDPATKEKLSQNHKAHLSELIERDFNHPSVIIWSLGNECETMHENGRGYFRDKVTFARSMDSSRPILFVLNSTFENELEADCFDLIAINMYPSWYSMYGEFERIEEELRPQIEGFRNRFHKPIFISEFGAETIPGLHDEHALMWTEEFQVEMLRRVIEISEEYPYVIGTHVWNFSDFRVGQHVARAVLNWKGVFTRDRHPKMAAHELRRLWTNRSDPK